MKTFTPKTLFPGYKLGLKTPHLFVGIPDKWFTDGEVICRMDNKEQLLKTKDAVYSKQFPDKFRAGTFYTLYYFLWKTAELNEEDYEDFDD